MSEQENVEVVQRLFSAVGTGDLPAALELLAPDIEFRSPVTQVEIPGIPWAKPRRGPAEVGAFFRELAERVQPAPMEPLIFTAQEDRVVVEGKNRGVVRSSGRAYEHNWVMLFTVRDGRIVRNLHYYDTYEISQIMLGG